MHVLTRSDYPVASGSEYVNGFSVQVQVTEIDGLGYVVDVHAARDGDPWGHSIPRIPLGSVLCTEKIHPIKLGYLAVKALVEALDHPSHDTDQEWIRENKEALLAAFKRTHDRF